MFIAKSFLVINGLMCAIIIGRVVKELNLLNQLFLPYNLIIMIDD